MGKRELVALLFFGFCLCSVCHGLLALPLGVICRLYSVIVAISGHILYHLYDVVDKCFVQYE